MFETSLVHHRMSKSLLFSSTSLVHYELKITLDLWANLSKISMKHLLGCFLFLFPSFMYAQQFESILMKYSEHYAPERIHLQLDRSVYGTGETIWFKAYIISGINNDKLSKNLYMDWIDDKAKLLAHQVYPITSSGITCGLFAIPVDFAGKVLHIHAYTKWMLNFDSTFLYDRDIRIVQQRNSLANSSTKSPTSNKRTNSDSVATISSTNASISPTITFFPEGGNMVEGIGSRIAFLCCDQWGRPVKITGEIKDSKGNKVADIETTHDGMGDCWLLPSSIESYTAYWKEAQGNMHQTPLPSIQSTGVVLSVSDVGDNKKFVLQRSDTVSDNLKQLHIVATMQQKPVYMANIDLTTETGTAGLIPETGLPAGGMVVTVFDNNWQPVAERLCFVDHLSQSSFTAQITWEKKSLDKRGYNQLLITIPDSIPANLSLSITDAGLPTDSIDNNNILSELLLTGDIRGKVYNPDYYFTDTTATIKQNLNLVMLTHGWRRYDWSKIVKREYPNIQYPRDTLYYTFSGKISGISQKKIDAAGTLFTVLKGADSSVQTQIITLNKDGSFAQPTTLLFDSTKIYYHLNGIKGPASYIELKLNQPEIFPGLRGYSIARNTPIYAQTTNTTAINERQFYFMTKEADLKAHVLAEVKVTAHKKTQLEKMDDLYVHNPLFKGNGAMRSFSFNVEHDLSAAGYVRSAGGILAYLKGRCPPDILDGAAIFIDEALIRGKDIGDFFPDISEIAYVKVFAAPFLGAPLGGNAIAIYTKRGDDIDEETERSTYVIAKGYSPLKEFYLPNYKGRDSSRQKEDIRQTIYWDPILLTIKNANKIRLGFYNNDVTKAFRIKLEGIDEEGKVTYLEEGIK